ncbi:UbiD family decarboxylase [Saccharibacillus alkalitolerans]|uniref:UbiD family decarboxylase n=1 Tax=Saccharibacillus alkalitolerans TaxID=2705290 RepID=A0ABX0F1Q0_9BACL|nr:UbiD family decarboxylase [Saccharibacillus alkalitolerans]NGZ74338.1 UbiD family decarboxylase [Saccharibacillus alkalitolerans]
MTYRSMKECIADLENAGHLIRITEEVDPDLEMAAVHLRTFRAGGPALYFEKVKGSKYGAVSNLFGTIERSKYMFRETWESTQEVIGLRNEPMKALKQPLRYAGTGLSARKALPIKKKGLPADFEEIRISDLPMIKSWPDDGGAFVTLPQVYSEDPDKPGIMNANLGMYRIQLSGNEYEKDREIGVHYQIHRGIGVHQAKAAKRGQPLKVSCFIGGPPAHTLSAVMPLPEGLSELTFAGLLSGRHFRYSYVDGFCVSHDADFVITGEIYPEETKPEGPFGDHLGYYSLVHEFPVMRVHKVYAKKDAVFPFTVVGRPPQEDTAFGALIHELTGGAVKQEIPGVKEVHAVDAAGVHPLLLAVGSERYTPYQAVKRPAEILTIANRILGTGQLSLAKYLFITAEDDGPVDAHDIQGLFAHILERIDLRRDLHFQTNTTIDTLDYSGTGLNSGSKVIFAAVGKAVRKLSPGVPTALSELPGGFGRAAMSMPGVALLQGPAFRGYESAEAEIRRLAESIAARGPLEDCPVIVLCDDTDFMGASFDNFLWAAFTRSNPSHDIHGINASYEHKHWGCDNVIIDARVKPHQAPPLVQDPDVTKRIERLFAPGGSLGILRAKR